MPFSKKVIIIAPHYFNHQTRRCTIHHTLWQKVSFLNVLRISGKKNSSSKKKNPILSINTNFLSKIISPYLLQFGKKTTFNAWATKLKQCFHFWLELDVVQWLTSWYSLKIVRNATSLYHPAQQENSKVSLESCSQCNWKIASECGEQQVSLVSPLAYVFVS